MSDARHWVPSIAYMFAPACPRVSDNSVYTFAVIYAGRKLAKASDQGCYFGSTNLLADALPSLPGPRCSTSNLSRIRSSLALLRTVRALAATDPFVSYGVDALIVSLGFPNERADLA
jgi:hypothetical protein